MQDRIQTQPFSIVVKAAEVLEDSAAVGVLDMVSQDEETAMEKIVDHLYKEHPESAMSMVAQKNGAEFVDIGLGEQTTPTPPRSAHTVNSSQRQ